MFLHINADERSRATGESDISSDFRQITRD